jgi:hypothetical protein
MVKLKVGEKEYTIRTGKETITTMPNGERMYLSERKRKDGTICFDGGPDRRKQSDETANELRRQIAQNTKAVKTVKAIQQAPKKETPLQRMRKLFRFRK